eukprot:scaffold81421_cov60-Phaeocystis_antarctica.AAC.1
MRRALARSEPPSGTRTLVGLRFAPGGSRAKCEGRPSNSQTRPVNSSRWMLPPLLRTIPCADVVPPLSEI